MKASGFALVIVTISVLVARTEGIYTHNNRRCLERKPNQPITKAHEDNTEIPEHVAH